LRSDDTEARKEARRCVGRSDRRVQRESTCSALRPTSANQSIAREGSPSRADIAREARPPG